MADKRYLDYEGLKSLVDILKNLIDGKSDDNHQHGILDIKGLQSALAGKISSSEKGAKNGVATLNDLGIIPASQLPSYVDEIVEVSDLEALNKLPVDLRGKAEDKIYVTSDTNLIYRYVKSSDSYIEISKSLALGEGHGNAYYGDLGKEAYDHTKITTGNPHKVTKSDVGLGSVDNTPDSEKTVLAAVTADKLKEALTINVDGKKQVDFYGPAATVNIPVPKFEEPVNLIVHKLPETSEPEGTASLSGNEYLKTLNLNLNIPQGKTGPQGPIGPTGLRGPEGPRGLQGIQGKEGPIGPRGPIGETGPKGATGNTGPEGKEGPQGLKGDPGRGISSIEQTTKNTGSSQSNTLKVSYTDGTDSTFNYYNGAQGARGPQGYGIKSTNLVSSAASGGFSEYTIWYDEETGRDPTVIKIYNGKDGKQGIDGAQGPRGLTGDQGPRGFQGETGPQGPKGATGPQGPAGKDSTVAGPQGPRGPQGPNVIDGTTTSSLTKNAYLQVSSDGKITAQLLGTAAKANIGSGASDVATGNHTHDDRYFTEEEVTGKLALKFPYAGGTITGATTISSTLSVTGDTSIDGVLNLKANQYGDTFTSGALNLNNSNIYGINSLIFKAESDNAKEGIHFYRDTSHVDTLWAKKGVLYFNPNRTLDTVGTDYKVWTSEILDPSDYVKTSVTINGKSLTSNISLVPSDIGASASGHNHDSLYYTQTQLNTKFKNYLTIDTTSQDVQGVKTFLNTLVAYGKQAHANAAAITMGAQGSHYAGIGGTAVNDQILFGSVSDKSTGAWSTTGMKWKFQGSVETTEEVNINGAKLEYDSATGTLAIIT